MNKISVIIPVYNEEKVILECLYSLSLQTRKDLEVIVVDDGSTDTTVSQIQNSKFKIRNLILLKQNHKGTGAARNLGASKAQGDILVFVDSDMTFAPDFISNLVEPIKKGESRGTFSKLEYVRNPDNIWSKCWGINEGWVVGMRHPKNYPDRQKVFRAILKSEFDRVGGFSLTGYTDDWTLSEKLGYEAESTKAVFYHKNPESLLEVYRQARWIGKRKYKLGKVGTVIALFRALFPMSIVFGMLRSITSQTPAFLTFKLVYDFGIFVGASSSLAGFGNAK